MPTYEYQCKTCGAVMDVFQSITAKPLKKHECPKCKKARAVQRLIGTGGALIFKGSGFYTTDYRNEGYKKAAKAESEAAKPVTKAGDTAKSGDAGKSETKAVTPPVEKKPGGTKAAGESPKRGKSKDR